MARTISNLRRGTLAIVAVSALLIPSVATSQQVWRYPLHAGDQLVLTETVEKETVGPETHSKAKATFENHILVLDDPHGAFTIAIQRNRKSAELLKAHPGNKPPKADDLKDFAQRLSTIPDRVAEANQIEVFGGLRLPPNALREWPSRALIGFEEFPQIAPNLLKVGEKWHPGGVLNVEFTVAGAETLDGRPCTVIEGAAQGAQVRVRYWLDDETHQVQRATYKADYAVPAGATHELVTLTLTNVTHNHTLAPWLASTETRLAALTALERFPTLAISVSELQPILASDDPEASTLALSIIARRHLSLDPASLNKPRLTPEGERLLAALQRGTKFQAPPFSAGTTMQLYLDPGRGLVPYVVRIPRDFSLDRPNPLLVYLAGGPGIALDALNNSLSKVRDSEYAVLYPNALGMWWERESTEMFDGLLKKVVADLHVSPQQTYISGFSNGGSGTEFYAARWPERFGAAVSLMGAGECGVLDSHAVEQLARVPLLLVHGRRDTIIPYECSEQLFHKLKKKKANVRLELFDKGHEITLDSDQGLTMEFLHRTSQAAVPATSIQ